MCAAAISFASCNKTDDLFSQDAVNEKIKSEYAKNFVAHFGEVSADQNWDFTKKATSETEKIEVLDCVTERPNFVTRGISSAAVENGSWNMDLINITNLGGVSTLNELSYIRSVLSSLPELDWTPNATGIHDMWVWYCCGGDNKSYSLGIHYIQNEGGSYNQGIEYYTTLPTTGGVGSKNGWYYGGGYAYSFGSRIDASQFQNPEGYRDIYWYAETGVNPDPYHDETFREKWELKKYKEVNTPNGAKYWCFDCDHDGVYSDMVCLVEPSTICKRYMIEDLGSTDDFDFNDIVVDVRDNGVKQYAKVRCMGGTLPFTLSIGNTEWTKDGAGFDNGTMYFPQGGYEDYLAEFEVSGWNPDQNNITIKVRNKDSEMYSIIRFPETGDIPMIFACNPTVAWASERTRFDFSQFK